MLAERVLFAAQSDQGIQSHSPVAMSRKETAATAIIDPSIPCLSYGIELCEFPVVWSTYARAEQAVNLRRTSVVGSPSFPC